MQNGTVVLSLLCSHLLCRCCARNAAGLYYRMLSCVYELLEQIVGLVGGGLLSIRSTGCCGERAKFK